MILDKLKAYGWMAAAIALGAVAGVQTLRLSAAQLDAATTRTAQADTLRTIADLTAAAERAVRAEETQWQNFADQKAIHKNDQIQALNARIYDLSGELRKRPARPTDGDMPSVTGACASATGSGLYRDDGEFLVRFAAEAARVAIERDYCYAQYDGLLNKPRTP